MRQIDGEDAGDADATAGAGARWNRAAFVERISFHAGGYDAPSSYEALDAKLRAYEGAHASTLPGNRIFFLRCRRRVGAVALDDRMRAARAPRGGFTRLMIEKPFGRDSASFDALDRLTSRHFDENQLFRVDHYLGKEILLNIPTLRWANAMFEPLWSNAHVESVQIIFKENIGTDGRGGYFDGFGIIRDIIQNHLLQAFMFVAWRAAGRRERERADTSGQGRAARCARSTSARTTHRGSRQFAVHETARRRAPRRRDRALEGSRCPAFAACVLEAQLATARRCTSLGRSESPFLLSAGKGLDERLCEIRVRFKPAATCAAARHGRPQRARRVRVQPDEAVYMVAHTKVEIEPGSRAGRRDGKRGVRRSRSACATRPPSATARRSSRATRTSACCSTYRP